MSSDASRAHRSFAVINPPELGPPRGFVHGLLTGPGGRLLFVSGQTAAAAGGRVDADAFVQQFETALARVLSVVRAAGGAPEHVTRMRVYVTTMKEYRESRRALGEVWRRQMGTHYPAMALVQVVTLVDEGALVEIEADAVLP
jgi:enamine deaminase RidA (YjgF/YER057c/UK114 family)